MSAVRSHYPTPYTFKDLNSQHGDWYTKRVLKWLTSWLVLHRAVVTWTAKHLATLVVSYNLFIEEMISKKHSTEERCES